MNPKTRFETKEQLITYLRENGLTTPDDFIRLGQTVAMNRHLDVKPTDMQPSS